MLDAWQSVGIPNNVMTIEYVDLVPQIGYKDASFTWDYYY